MLEIVIGGLSFLRLNFFCSTLNSIVPLFEKNADGNDHYTVRTVMLLIMMTMMLMVSMTPLTIGMPMKPSASRCSSLVSCVNHRPADETWHMQTLSPSTYSIIPIDETWRFNHLQNSVHTYQYNTHTCIKNALL